MSSLDDFAHLRIRLEAILSATNNFHEESSWGEFAFGSHYQGQLSWSGELIDINAQRWLNKEWDDEKEQQFWMEISMFSSLNHKNLASLVGFCDENSEKIIIIKLETKGSLENYLSDSTLLTWVRRLEISVGLAHALSYIHYDEQRDFSLIHRNIDGETVLLNNNWEPKLSEFRLSMKIKASQRHLSLDTGTVLNMPGYTDPTYLKTKRAHHKSDMYSFGIVLFELLCGRKSIIDGDYNQYLAPMAITHYREKRLEDIIDWNLWQQMDSESFNIFSETAYDCLNEERSQRPNIDEIVPKLEKALKHACENRPVTSLPSKEFAYLKVPLEDILFATNNLDEENHIRTNVSAKDYEGQLLWSGELIDINARRFNKEWNDREELFWTEISMLSTLKHKNLVSLVGFCDENDEKIIITRYETRGILKDYLRDPMLLTWVRRLEICVGIAHALSYIHYDEPRDFSVIHRNIESTRILLNDEWDPKLCDFEYSMKIKASQRHHSFHTNTPRYVIGYGDPTYIQTKSVNHKSEMYSFGILLSEVLCGTISILDTDTNKYLAHYREKRLNEIIDWDLWKQMDSQSFNIFTETAYDCLSEKRSQRPNIDEIVTRLEKALELQLEHQKTIMSSRSNKFSHLKVPLEDILFATNNFSEENHIRTSVYAKDYKGQLLWSGELIDISAKRFNKERTDREQMFWMEISMLSSLKHKNVVSLVGFCDENDEKIIIIKLETRGMLNEYLSDPMLLTWGRRLEICVGLAHVLSYIHYDEPRDFSVIHRFICTGIVLLNDEWEPKLCDFESSMKIKASQRHHSFHTNRLRYLIGYGDPTYIQTKRVSHKTDMYSFGVIMFELMCGRESISGHPDNKYLATVAIFHYKKKTLDEIIDPLLWRQMDPQSFNVFAELAYDCLNEERSQRPNIEEIVTRLESALKLQMEHRSDEHLTVAAEVEVTSSNHDKGSLTSIPTHVKSHVSKETKSFLKDPSHLKFSFEDIASATNNFSHENIITKFRHGTIFKGRLLHSQRFIDIVAKKFFSSDIKRESKKIWTEIFMLSSLKHKNIVSIIGFCDEKCKKIIIYKKVNKSLHSYLNDTTLKWMQRLKMCIGVAKALSYIHYDVGRDFSVIHGNIRSSKILLDDEWKPKLSGFELSLKNTVARRHRLLLTHDIVKNAYLDPKYKKTGGLTHKSDVYSFGVVLFELLCGISAIDEDEEDGDELRDGLLSKLAKSHLDDMIMPHLRKEMDKESLKIFSETAHW